METQCPTGPDHWTHSSMHWPRWIYPVGTCPCRFLMIHKFDSNTWFFFWLPLSTYKMKWPPRSGARRPNETGKEHHVMDIIQNPVTNAIMNFPVQRGCICGEIRPTPRSCQGPSILMGYSVSATILMVPCLWHVHMKRLIHQHPFSVTTNNNLPLPSV